jgi:hypothetical protein
MEAEPHAGTESRETDGAARSIRNTPGYEA